MTEDSPTLYYDINAQPMDARTYQLALKTGTEIARRKLWHGKFEVLTEWTGINMSYHKDADPVIFETSIILSDKRLPVVVERYTNIDDALDGHRYWSRYYRSPAVAFKSLLKVVE